MDHRDQPRDPRGPPPEQRFGPPSGPRDPRGDRGPTGPPNDGRFSGPVHSPQQQWGSNQGGQPPRLPQGKKKNNIIISPSPSLSVLSPPFCCLCSI